MIEINRLHHRSPIIAAVTATFFMFVFGASHRALTNRLTNPTGVSSMPPDALKKIPLQIGDWTGQEEPLDEAIIETADTDAHISRRYSRYNASEHVFLYIAAGKRARDLMPHRPEVCYTGAGWTRVSSYAKELLLEDGKKLPCSVFQFSKGALNTKNVIILDYYIVDGQLCRDISLMRSKIWRGSGTINYVAQVQIVTDITTVRTIEAALRIVSNFACVSAKSIFQVLESAADNENQDVELLSVNDFLEDLAGD